MINKGNGTFELWLGEKPKRIRVPKEKFIIYKGEKIELKRRVYERPKSNS